MFYMVAGLKVVGLVSLFWALKILFDFVFCRRLYPELCYVNIGLSNHHSLALGLCLFTCIKVDPVGTKWPWIQMSISCVGSAATPRCPPNRSMVHIDCILGSNRPKILTGSWVASAVEMGTRVGRRSGSAEEAWNSPRQMVSFLIFRRLEGLCTRYRWLRLLLGKSWFSHISSVTWLDFNSNVSFSNLIAVIRLVYTRQLCLLCIAVAGRRVSSKNSMNHKKVTG